MPVALYSCFIDFVTQRVNACSCVFMTALQIVSNRARSICYGVRQQHFRARAELTVNRLMASSEQQLSTLATISQTQEQLKAMADNTIEQLETGRQQIASDQQQLKKAHRIMNSEVLRNLQHIQQEKEVIIAGNEQLIAKTEQIQQKLDSTAVQVNEQAGVQSARHKELLDDLAHLGAQAEDVSSKLEASTAVIENSQRNVIAHQLDAIENLKRINDTMNFLLSLLNSVRDVVEAKLEWLLVVTGATDSRMAVISVLATHIFYAVVAVIFLSLFRMTRRIFYLLTIVILSNATAELKFGCGFGFTRLAAVLLAAGLIASIVARSWTIVFHNSPPVEPVTESSSCGSADCCHSLSSEDIKSVIRALEQLSAGRISGSGEQRNVENVAISCSTPIRHLPELCFASSSDRKQTAGFPLDSTPPPIRRHLLPATPHNPLPTPFPSEGSEMNSSGAFRLPQLDSDDGSWTSSPGGSVSCSGTPRTVRQKKHCSSSLSRSFSRPACIALTKSGQPCKLPSQEGSSLCYRHQHN